MKYVPESDYIWRSPVLEIPMGNDEYEQYKYLIYNDVTKKLFWEGEYLKVRGYSPAKCRKDFITTIKDNGYNNLSDSPT